MNIRRNGAGAVSNQHILKSGFKIDNERNFSDMGQMTVTMTDYSKCGKLFLTGGYWTYYIKNKDGNLLWEGWPNSNEEFDEVITKLEESI